jgi:F0F1-type ATP synthase assembly protein I
MGLLDRRSNDERSRDLRQVGLLAAVPWVLLAAPLVGFFVGQWLDGKFGTEPYLMTAGVILGFASAGVEVYRLVKKSAEIDKERKNE